MMSCLLCVGGGEGGKGHGRLERGMYMLFLYEVFYVHL